jgi:hypothetical protein
MTPISSTYISFFIWLAVICGGLFLWSRSARAGSKEGSPADKPLQRLRLRQVKRVFGGWVVAAGIVSVLPWLVLVDLSFDEALVALVAIVILLFFTLDSYLWKKRREFE